MPTLEIEGRDVEVDDSFLTMSPEEQNKAVDEIGRALNLMPAAASPAASQAAPAAEAAPAQRFRDDGVPIGDDREWTPPPAPAPGMPDPNAGYDHGALAASVTAGGQGLTLGFADEITAGLATPIEMGIQAYNGQPLDIGAAYDSALGKARGELERARQQHPIASTIGEIAGAAVLPGAKTASVPKAALQGAVMGGAYGFGSEDGTLKDRIESGGSGVLIGGTAGAALQGAANALGRSAARAAIPGADDLAAEARVLYDKADAAKVSIKAPSFKRAIDNMKFAAGRINRDLRPKTAGVVDDVQAMAGRDISLGEMDELRQTINKSLISAEPQDELMLGRMKTILDNFADNAGASDVTGDVAGLQYLKDARPLWARKSKSELIESLVERAKDQATGFENGMRTQFRALLGKPDRLKGFTPDEITAMRKIVRGGPLENAARAVAWLDPAKTLGAALSTITGVGAGAPTGAAAAALGMAGRKTAEALTRGNVRALDEIVRSGGKTVTELALEAAQGRGDQRAVELIQNYLARAQAARAPAAVGGEMVLDAVRR